MKTPLTQLLQIEHPIIMAPMFLVSNVAMVKAAMQAGIAGCIPALNYRTLPELREAITELKAAKTENGAFGFNLIVNKSNLKFPEQLKVCCELGCNFFITSLGNPKQVIEEAHQNGTLVFCDVVNLEQAKKVERLGCDAVIAVNNQAGGHRGSLSPQKLIEELNEVLSIPVISAGGVGTKVELEEKLNFGAVGVSIGSPFIASEEAGVSNEYKTACVQYGANDIVLTQKISGTPCTVINTPYVQEIGTEQTWLEKLLNKNKWLKKYVKMLRFLKGTNMVTKAATEATYKTVWVAGPTIEYSKAIEPIAKIIERFV
ncbi:NAD(P)H-dependent flavin oxidoreductase [Leeuwenhoekiella marinoflava]|uniref:Nitronate monooxygenase n=2 Tax=Leeuwenhoekiella marinoflava TaxID=988 RepID=A0A4Q0PQY1_9FLAO|nr:nitronate monooxygenase [Leeuwenhoekiella marinoflava]RXG32944.1 nitronate monooxygenase [Leeuwenhoekiella marinoflava]SHE32895.1 nitronate monooxygenase [Leeuwenhoekiella marinoflava DSM 3653]